MAKKREQRAPRGKDAAKRGSGKKKPCIFCKERIDWVDYKDVNLLRRFMSDRAKIRARRVTGNCTQHQRDVAIAIKTARELALLPYATRVATSRGGGRGGGRPRRDEGRDLPEREMPDRGAPGRAAGGEGVAGPEAGERGGGGRGWVGGSGGEPR